MKELEIKYQSNKTIIKREQLISIIKTWKTCLDWIGDDLQHWGFTPNPSLGSYASIENENFSKLMKNKVSHQPKTWLPLYPFNIYNIQNPKTHAPQKGKYKMSIPVFQ